MTESKLYHLQISGDVDVREVADFFALVQKIRARRRGQWAFDITDPDGDPEQKTVVHSRVNPNESFEKLLDLWAVLEAYDNTEH